MAQVGLRVGLAVLPSALVWIWRREPAGANCSREQVQVGYVRNAVIKAIDAVAIGTEIG
jgi:hypothetical protein